MSEPVPSWAHEPGLSQVICHCTGEQFVFLISDVAARLVCARCHAVNGEFSRQPGQPLVTFDDIPPAPAGGLNLPHIPPPPDALPTRDTIHGASGIQAGAAWSPEPRPVPGFDPYPDVSGAGVPYPPGDPGTYAVPGLPDMSPAQCNAYLRGGPPGYDSRLTYIPPDVVTYTIAGAGSYYRTLEVHDGRTVYLFKG